MTVDGLFQQICKKQSYLCVGLDTDPNKIPEHLKKSSDPVFEFNKAIIDSTHKFTVAYKPNIAFYEAMGISGWESLEKTINYIKNTHPDIFTIADAKRGDIGNTAAMYAKTFYQTFNFDAVTVNPYMGYDSVAPFLEYAHKTVILLALTSNEGSIDFQKEKLASGESLFERVIRKSQRWSSPANLMFVVGATQANALGYIREIAPEYFFLVPGVGTQGGDLSRVSTAALNVRCGLLVNSSRHIIYASSGHDFALKAQQEAQALQLTMATFLKSRNII